MPQAGEAHPVHADRRGGVVNLEAPFGELAGTPVERAVLATNIDDRLVLLFQLVAPAECYGYATGSVDAGGVVVREWTVRGLTLAGAARGLLKDLPPTDPARRALAHHPEIQQALSEKPS